MFPCSTPYEALIFQSGPLQLFWNTNFVLSYVTSPTS